MLNPLENGFHIPKDEEGKVWNHFEWICSAGEELAHFPRGLPSSPAMGGNNFTLTTFLPHILQSYGNENPIWRSDSSDGFNLYTIWPSQSDQA